MSSKTIGTTTTLATSGTATGVAAATFLVEATHWDLSTAGFGGLALLLSVAGALLGGYLAPSKRAEADAYIAAQTLQGVDPTSEDYAAEATATTEVQDQSEYAPAHGSTGATGSTAATSTDAVTPPAYLA